MSSKEFLESLGEPWKTLVNLPDVDAGPFYFQDNEDDPEFDEEDQVIFNVINGED